MADVVMLIGGTGEQTGAVYPGVILKSVWEAGVPSDFMGEDGVPVGGEGGNTVGYVSSGEFVIPSYNVGSFVNAKIGMFAYVYNTKTPLNSNAGEEGYYEIVAVTGTVSITVKSTNLDGGAISTCQGGRVDVSIGGAGRSMATADTMIVGNFGATLAHNVDVLDNLSETLGATTMAASSSLLKKIRYIGTVYDKTTVNNNFADCGSDEDKFPVMDMGSNAFSNTGAFLEFIHITITGTTSNVVAIISLGSTMYQCAVHNTGNSAYASQALQVLSGSAAINCHVTTFRGENENGYGAIINGSSYVIGCFVEARLGGGLQAVGNYHSTFFRNNIVIGGSSNTVGRGIVIVDGFKNGGLADISNNIIAGFSCGAYIGNLSDLNKNLSVFMNNIFWGTDAEGSVGLVNNTYDTKEATILLKNNFIGNFKTKSNFTYAVDDNIELTANPFKNGSGNMNLITDFYLNDTASGGALVKANWQPLDYDLNGTRDNYQCGTICAAPAAGGGGVSQLINGGFIK